MSRIASVLVIFSAALVTLSICCDASDIVDLFRDVRNAEEDNVTSEVDEERRCRFRDTVELYPPGYLWRYKTGAACYEFAQPVRLNHMIRVNHTWHEGVRVPYILFEGEPLLFDYMSERSSAIVRALFVNDRFFSLWQECSHLAVQCCEKDLNLTNVIPTEEYVCPALWDGWDCWPPARANETLRRICPRHAHTPKETVCMLESERYCLETDWNHITNYSTCSTVSILTRRHTFHFYALIVSTVISFPAVVIFFTFMRRHKDLRHLLYRSLLIAIILKNILTIVEKDVVILDALRPTNETMNVMGNNTVACRVLAFFNTFATNSVFVFMVLVGYYLHSTIARIFGKNIKLTIIYIIAFVGALVPALNWALAMDAAGQESCWVVDGQGFHWINDVYRYAVLIINFILLLDIIRVICTQRSKLNAKQTKSAAKAILVLIPLFGLPLLLISQKDIINQDDCVAGDIYYYVAYSMEALQGVVVALVFCYLSKDVHAEMRRWYRKFINNMNGRFGTNFRVPPEARVTTMTNVRPSGLDGFQFRDSANK